MTRSVFASTFFESAAVWSAKMYPTYLWNLLGLLALMESAHVEPKKIWRS
jgi:hypothetical protein